MAKPDILFVHPNASRKIYQDLSEDFSAIEPPIWAAMLCKYVSDKGFKAEILDCEAARISSEEAAQTILDLNPRVVCLVAYGQQPSASTQCMPGGKKTCDKLNKLSSKQIKTIVVGTHASALPKKTLEEQPYDFVCQGEGPVTIRKLIDYDNPNFILENTIKFKDILKMLNDNDKPKSFFNYFD